MIAENATEVIGDRIDILNRSLRDAAVTGVGKACDVHGRNTIVNGVDAACQIPDSQLLNRVSARIDGKHIVNGAVVSQFEFIHLPGCYGESTLDRNVLPALR